MACVTIHFVGPWRLFLGVRTVTAEVDRLEAARDFVEQNYGPLYAEKLKAKGIDKQQSVWDSSEILLNGKRIGSLQERTLKDGDILYLLPRIAGG